ncbi:6-phosphogluconolactonase [Candidatus Gottesmanbacteria bacterium]|nr:6-phosphogluconolactonase [Candidatus Gottesmanbacteria bacterium]
MITPHPCHNPLEAARKAGALLTKLLEDSPVLLLASGGSCLQMLDYTQARDFALGVLDERGDNFANLKKTKLFQRARTFKVTEKNLRDWAGRVVITQGIGPDGHTAGIMPARNASRSEAGGPYPEDPTKFAELFDNPDHWVVSYDATGRSPYPNRTTVTMPLLRRVNHSIVYVCGKEKQQALAKTLASGGSLAETPARIIQEMGKVDLFTDIQETR